jgi:hypothetical protein
MLYGSYNYKELWGGSNAFVSLSIHESGQKVRSMAEELRLCMYKIEKWKYYGGNVTVQIPTPEKDLRKKEKEEEEEYYSIIN